MPETVDVVKIEEVSRLGGDAAPRYPCLASALGLARSLGYIEASHPAVAVTGPPVTETRGNGIVGRSIGYGLRPGAVTAILKGPADFLPEDEVGKSVA